MHHNMVAIENVFTRLHNMKLRYIIVHISVEHGCSLHDAARGLNPTDATSAVTDVNSFPWSISQCCFAALTTVHSMKRISIILSTIHSKLYNGMAVALSGFNLKVHCPHQPFRI